ncbi:MAG TPA: hypothetical protein VN019_09255 [Oxalicibacterium sp.]|nr:hypothetical protein [Oxalicibacterium sp.]
MSGIAGVAGKIDTLARFEETDACHAPANEIHYGGKRTPALFDSAHMKVT